jgi:hypothetical protein
MEKLVSLHAYNVELAVEVR